MPSDPGRRSRIVVVELKSAVLSKKGRFYVKTWLNESQTILSKISRCNKVSDNPAWNQKLVFSVPKDFFQNNSIIWFQIFQARKYFSDASIGVAQCKTGSLFPAGTLEDNPIEKSDGEDCEYYEAKYDLSEDEDPHSDNDSDDDVFDLFRHENNDEARDEKSPTAAAAEKEKEKVEEASEVKKSVRLGIWKDSLEKGNLNVEIAVWKKEISPTGDMTWPLVMVYEEFMASMLRRDPVHNKVQPSSTSPWMCFATDTSNIRD